jgi:hypothetical protein
MGKPGRKASNGFVRQWDVQNFVAITEVIANGDGTYDVVGFARPYQQVSVQTFDVEGGNPSAAVNANPDIAPYGWRATVTPAAVAPICFVAQGLNGATSTCTYPPVGMFFFTKPRLRRTIKETLKKK